MRLFIAVDLPKEVKDHLYDLQSVIREAKVNWVHKKNMHLTLKFIGEVEEKDLEIIKDKLSKIKHEPFEASLGEFGTFSMNGKMKIMWVSILPENKVIQLQQKVDEELLNLYPGDTKFQSHITLGRIKSIRRKPDFTKSLENIKVKPIKFTIEKFQLIKSELSSNGPQYEIVEEY